MPKKTPPESALFVRLPTAAVDRLRRAADALGMRQKDLVASLVSKYVDPDSGRGLHQLGALSTHKLSVGHGAPGAGPTVGSYSFQAYDRAELPADALPEVLNAEQTAQFLQVDEAVVVEMAESGKLPGRKLGAAWRFSRAALVAWLSGPPKR
jgi:excisionase family DNA binding protein